VRPDCTQNSATALGSANGGSTTAAAVSMPLHSWQVKDLHDLSWQQWQKTWLLLLLLRLQLHLLRHRLLLQLQRPNQLLLLVLAPASVSATFILHTGFGTYRCQWHFLACSEEHSYRLVHADKSFSIGCACLDQHKLPSSLFPHARRHPTPRPRQKLSREATCKCQATCHEGK